MTNDRENIKPPTTCNGQCKFIETMLIGICETCGADDYPKPIKTEVEQINTSYE